MYSCNSKLPTDLKKFIVNKNLGLIEKKKYKKLVCKAFKNCNEALHVYYQTRLNKSQIYSIDEKETIEMEESIDPLDQGTDSPFKTRSLKRKIKDMLHILCVTKEENLTNGFLPIKELIYEIRDLKNY